MRKFICIAGILLLLTGCSYESYDTGEYGDSSSYFSEDLNYGDYNNEAVYLSDSTKKVAEEINALREKYKDTIENIGADSLYINIYEDSVQWMNDIVFSNYEISNAKYFNDLVEVLDKSIASGLKDYVSQAKDMKIEENDIKTKKIGRTVVYTENQGGNGANYIHIKINLLDIKDEYYSEVFDKISDDKYILGKVVMGNDLNLIDFANISSDDYMYPYDNLNIRYNMFFKDQDFKKINILIQGENGDQPNYDDMGVFINLLNRLDIKKQDEKDILINEYKNVLKGKSKSKDISFDNYDLLIKSGKGNTYTGNDRKLVYFSIEVK